MTARTFEDGAFIKFEVQAERKACFADACRKRGHTQAYVMRWLIDEFIRLVEESPEDDIA